MAISQEIIEAVRERVSITELVSEVVELKRSGRHMVGLCPFHAEKTPSFFVREEEGSFCCFGCGKRGSAFDFLMETRGLVFPEAVRFLANKIGLKVPESKWKKSDYTSQEGGKKLRLASTLVQNVYRDALSDNQLGKPAREYLRLRGITSDSIEKYKVGYAPNSWNFVYERVARACKEKPEIALAEQEVASKLLELGLIKPRKNRDAQAEFSSPKQESKTDSSASIKNNYYDVFRDRIIFPISRSDGSPMAFGGRILESSSDAPKYMNTQESKIYLKRQSLFGLPQAILSMRKNRHVFVVEGYLDVLSMFQVGFAETVATCGTAITNAHAQLLKRFVEKVTVVFDGDVAGRRAAANCFEVFLNTGIDVSVVLLDEGEDPDSIARKKTKQELEVLFEHKSSSALDVFIRQLFKNYGENQGSAAAAACGKVASQFASRVVQVKNLVEREALIERASELLGVSVQAVSSLVAESSKKVAANKPRQSQHRDRPAKVVIRGPERVPVSFGTKIGARVSVEESQPPVELSTYCRQIIVAVLLNPPLANVVLKMSVLGSEEEVIGTMPENVSAFIGEFAQVEVGEIIASRNVIDGLLAKHSLGLYGLIDEAFQQVSMGGADPEGVIGELQVAATRRTLKAEVAEIRSQEHTLSSSQTHEQIVQKKLLKRRDLDRLKAN